MPSIVARHVRGCGCAALEINVFPLSTSSFLGAVLLTATLAGCATYQADPLPGGVRYTDLGRVQVDAAAMPLPALGSHRFDPADGLDIDEVAMLAVANNPALRLARDDVKIAQAQAFSAGLLPDPQLGYSADYPSGSGSTSSAFNVALSMDLMAILRRPGLLAAARADAGKVDLGLLWQEWQSVAQARQLFIKLRFQRQVIPPLAHLQDLTELRYQRMRVAQEQGALTGDVLTAAATARTDAQRQLNDAQRAESQTAHDLNGLLGLAAETVLDLVGADDPPPVDAQAVSEAMGTLPARRPDLLALRAGYAAQDQKYRNAILDQFPSLSIGFVKARDNSSVYTNGFQVSLNLPIFNRNRGSIAIEQATRQRLKDEYQIRLNQAASDIARLRDDLTILGRQLTHEEQANDAVANAATAAQDAYLARNLAVGAYVDAQSAEITHEITMLTLRESIAEQRIGLQALLGSAIPTPFTKDIQFTHDAN